MLTWIVDNLLPFSVVDEDEIGVFLRGGRFTRTLTKGVYFTIPLYDSVRTVNKNPTPLELTDQAITIKGRAMMVSVYVKYIINDAYKALLESENYEELLGNEALALVQELSGDMLEVLDELTEEASAWGIEIEDVRLNQKAPCRVFKVVK